MRPGLSQGADCLPVSLLLLHSSSQAQVCVGSARVLSDDSNSCCVLALTHTHKEKHTSVHTHTASDLPHLHPTYPRWTVFSAYQNYRHTAFIDAAFIYPPSFFFLVCEKVYKASCCPQCTLAAGQRKQGGGNRLLLDHGSLMDTGYILDRLQHSA